MKSNEKYSNDMKTYAMIRKDVKNMDKLDYAILNYLQNTCRAVTKMSAATRKAILAEIDANENTLYRRLNRLAESGDVGRGIRESREHTYYITENGKKSLKGAME